MEPGISLTYDDKILVAIAASLGGGGALVWVMTPIGLRVGLLTGALVGTICIYDAMFPNPPRPASSSRAKAAAIVWHVFLGVLLVATFF